jgi:hypothetical protein
MAPSFFCHGARALVFACIAALHNGVRGMNAGAILAVPISHLAACACSYRHPNVPIVDIGIVLL